MRKRLSASRVAGSARDLNGSNVNARRGVFVAVQRGVEQWSGQVPREEIFHVLAGDRVNDKGRVRDASRKNARMIDQRTMPQDPSAW